MLRVDGLETAYGPVRALDGVSFEVPGGSITAVLGANGAGKTSLLRTLSGLVRPRAGRIRLDGRNIRGLAVERIVRLGMAHVPEGRGIIGELGVEENLRLGGLWRGSGGRDGLAEVYELFPRLDERRTQAASSLSGGERQMLAIGRALMSRPRLLLLDEPSLGLAPQIVAQIMALLRDLRERTGLTVLLVEQNARAALSVADRGIVLNLGRVVADDAPAALSADDGLRHAYLGFAPWTGSST
jgi:branched-chain amino acid transport system ATP-binding protein